MQPLLLLVTGQPGAGKSTLARALAEETGLPLIAKDTIKETLATLADPETVSAETSKALGVAAFEVVFSLLQQGFDAIAEASWNPVLARPHLDSLPHVILELHCSCESAIARQRYIERAPERHWIHVDADRFDDDRLWASNTAGPISPAGGIVISIDTNQPVDLQSLVAEIRRAVLEKGGTDRFITRRP